MSCDGCSFAGQSTALENTYVGVRFGEETNLTLCASQGLLLAKNAKVVVAAERGPMVGWVEKSPMPVFKPCQKSSATKVLRLASKMDLERDDRRKSNEHRAQLFCRERSKQLGLRMKVSRVDFNLNGSNAVFYFTADGRVDFRQLVRDLARRFKVRVRMVQLGARDEAKLLGGVGVCGKTLCCSSWIGEFKAISVQMAKRQGLSLNPTKISGQCGRLLCCLKFEDDQYRSASKPTEKTQGPMSSGARNGGAASASKNPVRLRAKASGAKGGSNVSVRAAAKRAASRADTSLSLDASKRLNVLSG